MYVHKSIQFNHGVLYYSHKIHFMCKHSIVEYKSSIRRYPSTYVYPCLLENNSEFYNAKYKEIDILIADFISFQSCQENICKYHD